MDGRALRSRSVPGLEQEIFALLTVYQALVRMAGDVTTVTPGLSVQRVSFTVLFQAASDQIIVAPGSAWGSTASLIGANGRAVLANLLPEQCRQRLKARYRKASSKYQFQRDQHPRTVQTYTLDFKMVEEPCGSRTAVLRVLVMPLPATPRTRRGLLRESFSRVWSGGVFECRTSRCSGRSRGGHVRVLGT